MPLVDMPLDKLADYAGRTPKPADHDDFWNNSLHEMHALGTNAELVPYPFDAPFCECFDLYFTGTFGARIHAKFLRPVNVPAPHPAVLSFHGYSGSSGDWTEGLKYAARGFSYAALDCRGQAGQSEDAGGVKGNTLHGHIIRGLDDPDARKLYYRNVFLDTAQLARIVMAMPDVDAARVGATGGSQGGGLTLACAALEPRIARAAPVYPFLCDYQRVWEMDQDVAAYKELRDYFRNFDPRHEREAQVFNKLGYIDVQHLAPRIRANVLMGVGLMDTVCPPSTQYAAFNKIPGEKHTVIYPDFGHEGLPRIGDTIYEFLGKL